ncbi:hypothetical protein [Pseudomonas putida]|uniref:Uncharacterized protein n=1 Tax=Pseudomonas putida TaxID=303 RepID=A0A8I1EBY9_PSEPU|nr:hypothetical protein [Pseudomonas putida]MBI6882483.1 hypothetical protein [Pseudomonas putida]
MKLLRALVITTTVGISSLAKADPYVFHQQWIDHSGSPRTFSLSISEDRVRQALTEGRDLHNYEDIFREIIAQARIMASELSTSTAQAKVTRQGMSYSIDYRYRQGHGGEAKAIGGKIQKFIDGAYDDLRSVTYYRQDLETHTLIIDYNDIVGDFNDVFASVDSFFRQSDIGKTDAEKINDRLVFLQSIPYDDMLKSDFDLNTPIRMLAENKGDCESKQVFMAGLLRKLFPQKNIQLVTLPAKEHIVLAIEMPEMPVADTFIHGGRRYAILDATGPATSRIEDSLEIRVKNDFDYGKQRWIEINE